MHSKKIAALLTLMLPAAAFAHAGHAESGVLAGLMHPFTGLDHLLAIVGVGLWGSRQQQSQLNWQPPLAFISLMLIGAIAATMGLHVPALEPMLAISLLVIGLGLTLNSSGSLWLVAGLCGAAGFLHGAAHGHELEGTAALAGMLVATAVGHAGGLLLGRFLGSIWLWRASGLLVAGAGASMLVAAS